MNSGRDMECSHSMGSPIRKSPDHGLLASPRGLSQLATSFIAYLRQGIHTHALSSLTIKFTFDTNLLLALQRRIVSARHCNLCIAHQYSIVKDRFFLKNSGVNHLQKVIHFYTL